MTDLHLHLVLNHFPLIGLSIGILVLLFGFLLKKEQIKATALGIFIFSAIMAVVVNYTGEGAEHAIENLPGINEQYIEIHEGAAELFLIMIFILGAFSIITMFLTLKNKKYTVYGYGLVVLVAIATAYTAINVGASGGEIIHSEIRPDTTLDQQNKRAEIESDDH